MAMHFPSMLYSGTDYSVVTRSIINSEFTKEDWIA